MSDDLNTFRRKTDRMFDEVERQLRDIARVWQIKVATQIILETWGPGKQWPATEYQAVGRLRAGWQFTFDPPPEIATKDKDGPFDYGNGNATASRLALEITTSGFAHTAFLWNDTSYAMAVHEGWGGNAKIGPRPWVDMVVNKADVLLDEARRDVMSASA